MYGPDATHTAGWNWANAVLDFNRDDYYRANVPGCPDLSNSPYLGPLHSVSVMVSGPGTVTSSPAGIDCPGSCTGMFQRSVTLTATPSAGAIFKGWTGACSGTAACTVAGEGSLSASFSDSSHRRTLTLRVRAQRATGALRVADGYEQCRARAPVVVERRGRAGLVDRPQGANRRSAARSRFRFLGVVRPIVRARPRRTANGERCAKAVSRTAKTAS